MRIAVTGGTGLVGSHVVEEALRRGHEVKALVRASSDTAFLRGLGANLVVGDLFDHEALAQLCRDVDVLVNCAAQVGDWGRIEDFRRVNVDALGLLLDEASKARVQRFVHISSLGVYEARDHHGTDEDVLPAIDSLDAYTRSKTEAEVLLLAYAASAAGRKACATYGEREVMLPYVEQVLALSSVAPADRIKEVVVLRPGFIYGPRDRTVLPKLMGALKKNQFVFFGDGRQAMNVIHVGHIVQAVFRAVDSDLAVGHVFNLTDGAQLSKRDFVGEVASAMGIAVPSRSIPLGVARLLAAVVHDVAAGLGASKPPLINKARFKFIGLHLDYSIAKARRMLGYNPDPDWRSLVRRSVTAGT